MDQLKMKNSVSIHVLSFCDFNSGLIEESIFVEP